MAEATFTEVLQIQLQVEDFIAKLKTIKEAYDKFVQEAGTQGVKAKDIIDVGGLADLSSTLKSFASEVATLREAFIDLAVNSKENLKDVAKAAEGAGKQVERIGQAVTDAKSGGGGTEGVARQGRTFSTDPTENKELFDEEQVRFQEDVSKRLRRILEQRFDEQDSLQKEFNARERNEAVKQLERLVQVDGSVQGKLSNQNENFFIQELDRKAQFINKQIGLETTKQGQLTQLNRKEFALGKQLELSNTRVTEAIKRRTEAERALAEGRTSQVALDEARAEVIAQEQAQRAIREQLIETERLKQQLSAGNLDDAFKRANAESKFNQEVTKGIIKDAAASNKAKEKATQDLLNAQFAEATKVNNLLKNLEQQRVVEARAVGEQKNRLVEEEAKLDFLIRNRAAESEIELQRKVVGARRDAANEQEKIETELTNRITALKTRATAEEIQGLKPIDNSSAVKAARDADQVERIETDKQAFLERLATRERQRNAELEASQKRLTEARRLAAEAQRAFAEGRVDENFVKLAQENVEIQQKADAAIRNSLTQTSILRNSLGEQDLDNSIRRADAIIRKTEETSDAAIDSAKKAQAEVGGNASEQLRIDEEIAREKQGKLLAVERELAENQKTIDENRVRRAELNEQAIARAKGSRSREELQKEQELKNAIERLDTRALERRTQLETQRRQIIDASTKEELRNIRLVDAARTHSEQTLVQKTGQQLKDIIARGGAIRQFFGGLTSDLARSVGNVVKFQLAWNATQLAVQAVLLPIQAVAGAIRDGINFAIQFEDKVADIREVLVQNVEFSRDGARNFELAGKAAAAVLDSQLRLSNRIGVAQEKFQSVFEAFLQSRGSFAAVGNDFEKVNRSIAILISGLNSVGISTKDTRRATNEINKLLEARVTTADKIRVLFGLSADELNRQVKLATEKGKLDEFIEKSLAAQADRINTTNLRFSVLLENVKLLSSQINAAASEDLFKDLFDGFKAIQQFFKDNETEIVAFGKVFADIGIALLDIIRALAEAFGLVGENTDSAKVWVTVLGFAAETVAGIARTFATIIRLAGRLQEAVFNIFSSGPIAASKRFFDGVLTDFGRFQEGIDKAGENLSNLLNPVKKAAEDIPKGIQKLKAGGGEDETKKAAREAKQNLQSLISDFKTAQNEITNATKNFVSEQELLVKSRVITETEATEAIIGQYNRQAVALETLSERFIKSAKKLKALTPQELNRAINLFRRSTEGLVAAGFRSINKERGEEFQRQFEIRKRQLDAETKIAESGVDRINNIIRAALDERLIDQSTALETQRAVERKFFEFQRDTLLARRDIAIKAQKDVSEIDNDLAVLKAKFEVDDLDRIVQIEQAKRREIRQTQELQVEGLAVQRQLLQLQDELQAQTNAGFQDRLSTKTELARLDVEIAQQALQNTKEELQRRQQISLVSQDEIEDAKARLAVIQQERDVSEANDAERAEKVRKAQEELEAASRQVELLNQKLLDVISTGGDQKSQMLQNVESQAAEATAKTKRLRQELAALEKENKETAGTTFTKLEGQLKALKEITDPRKAQEAFFGGINTARSTTATFKSASGLVGPGFTPDIITPEKQKLIQRNVQTAIAEAAKIQATINKLLASGDSAVVAMKRQADAVETLQQQLAETKVKIDANKAAIARNLQQQSKTTDEGRLVQLTQEAEGLRKIQELLNRSSLELTGRVEAAKRQLDALRSSALNVKADKIEALQKSIAKLEATSKTAATANDKLATASEEERQGAMNELEKALALRDEAAQSFKNAAEDLGLSKQFEALRNLEETVAEVTLQYAEFGEVSRNSHLESTLAAKAQEAELLRLQAILDEAIAREKASLGSRILDTLIGRERSLDAVRRESARRVIGADLERRAIELGNLPTDTEKQRATREIKLAEFNQAVKRLESLDKPFNDFQTNLNDAANAVLNVRDTILNIASAFQQGIGQGITAIGSTIRGITDSVTQITGALGKTLSGSLGKVLGAAGPIAQIAGVAVEIFTAIMSRAARRIAAQMEKDFNEIIKKFEQGAETLGNTLADLERKRTEAIIRLSGKKGGQKELDKLLPEFDQAIENFKKQQKQIQETFEADLENLRLGSGELADFNRKWEEINERVKEYLGSFADADVDLIAMKSKLDAATETLNKAQADLDQSRASGTNFFDYYDAGNLDPLQQAVVDAQAEVDRLNKLYGVGIDLLEAQGKAAEFISRSLGEIRADALARLEDAEQQAIQDALKLNDLFEQRKDIVKEMADAQKEFNEQQFALLTADAEILRIPGVVQRGSDLIKLREKFAAEQEDRKKRLNDLNLEILTQSKIVAEEGKIFNLAGSIAQLRARSQELTFQNQQREIAGWREILAIANGIKQAADGTFFLDPALRDQLLGVPPTPAATTAARQTAAATDNSTVQNTFEFQVNVNGDASTSEKKQVGREIWEAILNEGVRLGFNNS